MLTLPATWRIWAAVSDWWQGKVSLAKAFWVGLVIGGICGATILGMLVGLPFLLLDARPEARLAYLLIFWGFQIVASVGVWRSANAIIAARVGSGQKVTHWEATKIVLAKLYVVLWWLGLIVRASGKPLDLLVTDVLRFIQGVR
jgi:hypothetical protein